MVAKFFLLFFQHRLSSTKADNILIYDREMMEVVLVVVLEIDFTLMIIEGIQDFYHLPLFMSFL